MFNKSLKSILLSGAGFIGVGLIVLPVTAFANEEAAGLIAVDAGELVGVVTDLERGGYLVGAEVRIEGHGPVAVTDREGRFSFQRAPIGRQTLVIQYFGRATYRTEVIISADTVTSVTAALPADSGASSVDELVVIGRRPQAESEAAALQLQRSSTALVNVVSADAIGHFPDQNIAAALSRLPGVAVERDQGQERSISLRGAPSRWSTISFDGVNVIAPGGKSARTDTIPASIARSVTVRKAVTAAMSGETLAGNIDIATRGAFDYPDLAASLNFGYGYNDLGGRSQYDLGGFIADTFGDGRFGVALSASRYERNMITDNFETDWEVASEDREPGSEDRTWADAHQNKLYRLTRSNTAYAGRFDFRPSDEHRFFLTSIYTEFTDDEMRNAHEFDLDDGAVRTDAAAITRGYADVRTGNSALQGTIYGVELDSTLNINHTLESIFTNTLGGEQRFDEWGVSWRLNYTQSRAEGGPSFNSAWRSPRPGGVIDYSLRPTVVYDFTNREQHGVQLFETIVNPDGTYSRGDSKRSLDPQDYEFVYLRSTTRLQDSQSYSARIDLSRDLTLFGRPTELQFGGQYDDRTKEDTRQTLEIVPAMLTAAGVPFPSTADFAINDPYMGELPLGYAFRYFSESGARDIWNDLHGRGLSRIQANTSETNNYEVSETVLAGYAMATTYFDWGNVLVGVRAERVDNEGEALVSQGAAGFQPVRVGGDNVVVLPSAHLNWDINDQLKLRLSANTGAARPDFTLLRPNFSINDEDEVISGGNPSAGPERAQGVDAYLEWYLPSGAFFSVGAYYKRLEDVLFSVTYPRFGSDVLNQPGIDRSEYTYSTTDNGGSGYLRGLEVAFSQTLEPFVDGLGLPDWAAGFGVRGNLTLNDSETETPDNRKVPLPGASDLIYNAAVSYERYGFSSRVSWQYRTKWLDSLGDGDILGDGYWDEVGRLDFKASYAFNDHAEIYFDANNLLDEPGIRYQGEAWRVSEYERFGARYMIGMRLNF
ncbi:MAG: TonB-dependent receptor [Brevundimonas sp.]|uniref:TonB-dependent receptor n=1 Tax=Brevundimonas sp. TaxID=1871086 RepID=UPI00391A52CB